jgi:hypothetical protein
MSFSLPHCDHAGGEKGHFATNISYGDFDFDFAVELMEYIMSRCWTQRPGEHATAKHQVNLFLPTEEELIADHRQDLLNGVSTIWGIVCCELQA